MMIFLILILFFCSPGPGKHLCSHAVIKSKFNLVPPGESPKGIPQGTQVIKFYSRNSIKMNHFIFRFSAECTIGMV